MCKQLKFGKMQTSTSQQDLGATASPSSKLDWSALLSADELKDLPDRDDPVYLGLCEKTISELKEKLEEKKELEKVQAAEDEISGLMAQLSMNSRPVNSSGDYSSGFRPSVYQSGMPKSPNTSHAAVGDVNPHWSNHDLAGPLFSRAVVERGDSKEYLGKMRPESHLVPPKPYESMNFRELLLGMSGVHQHLVQNGRPTHGYEMHTLFILRKSVSYLYTNAASVLYEKYVTDKVLSGEFLDYPSSCIDAALEFFCDTYRKQESSSPANASNQKKPWSGYPYPYCYFFNEGAGCHKKSCSLRHECGYCHVTDHRSKECSKSAWKKSPTSPPLTRGSSDSL